jgi:predicted RNA-binding protein with RPS1 domain
VKVILRQCSPRWIDLCIESREICTITHTSSSFDPYKRLYIFLGQIRDAQVPVSMIIDEEGYGIKLIVNSADNDTVLFQIEPWLCGEDHTIRLQETIDRRELIKAFHDGIIEFIDNEFIPSDWSYIDNLSYQNWQVLLRNDLEPQNWNRRLILNGLETLSEQQSRQKDNDGIPKYTPLNMEQEFLLTLRSAIQTIAELANRGRFSHIQALTNLYNTLLLDIILGELDPSWYIKRRIKLNIEEGGKSWENRQERDHRLNLREMRIKSLKIGQLIDGTIVGIKKYGVFVNIGGYTALLFNPEISQVKIEDPSKIFQQNDWVRAIIVSLNVEKGRISLSTSILEPEAGDMLREPYRVYEKAEEMADRYHRNVLSEIKEEI